MSERFVSLTRCFTFAILAAAGLCRQSSNLESRGGCPNRSDGKPLYATVNNGDTCTTISENYHVSTADFEVVNSLNADNCTNLIAGKQVCIPIPCEAYKVQPSDTCQSIVDEQKISSLGAFFGFNPGLNNPSCDNLKPGSNICLSGPIGRQFTSGISFEGSSPSSSSAASSSFFTPSASSSTFSTTTPLSSAVVTATSTTLIQVISCPHAACHHSYSFSSSYSSPSYSYSSPSSPSYSFSSSYSSPSYSYSSPSSPSYSSSYSSYSSYSSPSYSSYSSPSYSYSSYSSPSYSYSYPSPSYSYSSYPSPSPSYTSPSYTSPSYSYSTPPYSSPSYTLSTSSSIFSTTMASSNFVIATSTTLINVASCPGAACHRSYFSSTTTTSKYLPLSYPPPSYLPPSYLSPSYLSPSYPPPSVGTVTSTSVLTVTSTSVVTVTSTSKIIITSSSYGGCTHSKPHPHGVVTAKSTTMITITSCAHPCTRH